MEQKFDWRCGGAVYLALVSATYIVIGLLGLTAYAPLPFLLSVFLTVSPYPLLQFMMNCATHFSCGPSAMQFDFSATQPFSRSFAASSVVLVVAGSTGLVAIWERGAVGRTILSVLCSLGTLASLAICIGELIYVLQGNGFDTYTEVVELGPSCLWSLSYWIALSKLRTFD